MWWILVAAGAQAAEPSAMNGHWRLDPDRSGELMPFMKAVGFSWIERQVGKGSKPEHTISVAGDRSTIQVDTLSLGQEKRETLTVNGRRAPTSARGFDSASHVWTDAGVLVSTMWGTRDDGAALVAVVERQVVDDGTLRFDISLTVDDASPMKVERVFVRQ
ncbi:MAG: hypothetical protein AAF211_04730 [Myxococcota bacterium]